MVGWLLLRAGSRLLSKPKAEATGLAPKQSADAHDPLASPSEGFVLVNPAIPACWAGSCLSASASIVRSARRLGVTLRVGAAFPFGQPTAGCVFVEGIALVKSRS